MSRNCQFAMAGFLCLALAAVPTAAQDKARGEAKGPQPAATAAAVPDDVQDLLYLGEQRPLRIRLHLRINGKPFRQPWDDFLGRLFAYADLNGDKALSKEEASRLPPSSMLVSLFQGQLGFFGPAPSPVPFAQLDADKDGKVTLEEMKAYYRKSGFAPVQTQGDPDQTTTQLTTNALFKQLDRDGDGKLSEQELKSAEEALRPLDTNEDELLTLGELIPGSGRFFPRPGPSQGSALVLVNRDDPPAKQAAPILARYKKEDVKLTRAQIGFDAATFAALDVNKDGVLDANELARWLAQPADLELLVPLSEPRVPPRRFGRQYQPAPDAEKPLPVEVFNPNGRAMPLAASLRKKGDTALVLTTVSPAGTTFLEFQNERGSQGNFLQSRRYFLERFKGALRGKTYLTKRDAMRIPNGEFGALFTYLDRNGDGKLTEEEVSAFLDLLAKSGGFFTVAILSDRGPGLFELLDTNHDKHLGVREMRNAWQVLAPFTRPITASTDSSPKVPKALTKQQVPRFLYVTLCAGIPSRVPSFFGRRGDDTPAKERTAGPLWFRTMDINGDGDVSRKEWLGSEEDFRKIDTDGDGLIDVHEAEKADRWFRQRLQSGAAAPGERPTKRK